MEQRPRVNPPGYRIGSVAAAPSSILTADGRQMPTTDHLRGIPTRWTIQSSAVTTCAATFVVPAWSTGARLQLGPNVFDLPALPAGVIH